jgi:MFS family permease
LPIRAALSANTDRWPAITASPGAGRPLLMGAPAMSIGRRYGLLATILLGTLMGPLDAAVNIAFPDITQSFGIELAAIRWVIIVYVATYASLMLIFGRLGDLFGHNRVFGGGLVVCIAGFAICSLADSFAWLLVARVLQGLGTAMVLSCGPALATNLFSEDQRPRILGIYAMMFGLGGAVGPSLGGLLAGEWGWPAVFWFRLPLAVLALILMVLLRLPSPPRDGGRFDLAGAALLAAGTSLVLLTFTQLQWAAAYPLEVAAAALAAIAVFTAYAVAASRSPTPVLDLQAFRNFRFAWINASNVVINFTGFATMLFVPYFLVRVSAVPLWQGGLIMAAGPVAMMLAANLAGRSIAAVGGGRLALAGAVLVAAGLGWMSFWDGSTSHVILVAALMMHGAGLGLFQVAGLEIVARTLPVTNRGVAGSLALVMRTIGVVVAASTLTLVFTAFEQSAAAGTGDGFVAAFQQVFRLASLLLAAYTILSCAHTGLWRRRDG